MKKTLYLSLFIFSLGCQQESLRKLSPEETLTRAKAGTLDYMYAEFRNQDGEPLSDEERRLLNSGKFLRDFYVDGDENIKQVRAVPPTRDGKFVEIQLREVANSPLQNVRLFDIDCSDQKTLLAEVYASDQDVRTGGEGNMEDIDSKNQQKVVSLIEKCGFPTKSEVGEDGMTAVFLVIQHSSSGLMAYYYPQLLEAVEQGDISKSSFALMQDRLLMWNGFKQIYGSQIRSGHLYDLEDPEAVNERRSEMGLGPIEEYLTHWSLDFETEVAQMQQEAN